MSGRTAQTVARELVDAYPDRALELVLEISQCVIRELAIRAIADGRAEGRRTAALRMVETPQRILEVVAAHYEIPLRVLTSPSREQRPTQARHAAWSLMRTRLSMSLDAIGATCERDHTTVMGALKKYVPDEVHNAIVVELDWLKNSESSRAP